MGNASKNRNVFARGHSLPPPLSESAKVESPLVAPYSDASHHVAEWDARVGCDCSYTTKASIERLLAPFTSASQCWRNLKPAFLRFSHCVNWNLQCLSNQLCGPKHEKDLFGSRRECQSARQRTDIIANDNEWVESELSIVSYFKRPAENLHFMNHSFIDLL